MTAGTRPARIDAPESRQNFGPVAQNPLPDLVFARPISAEVETTDCYGRRVGTVRVDDLDITLEQMKRGMAWVCRQYARSVAASATEVLGRAATAGSWSPPDAVPSWEFRREAKGAASHSGGKAGPSGGDQPWCGQTVSSAEARRYGSSLGFL